MQTEFRSRIKNGDFMVGTWVTTSDPAMAEVVARGGLDFVIIDTEHSPYSPETLQTLIMAMSATDCAVMVRVGSIEPVELMRPLDMGADGLVIPRVDSPEEVEHIVRWTRYPPHGIRGYGPRRAGGFTRHEPEYVATSESRVAIVPMVETAGAVEMLDKMITVPGIDGLLVGRNDLSAALGLAGKPNHPDVLETVDRVASTCRANGLATGIAAAPSPEEITRWENAGIRLVAAGLDYEFLRHGVDALAASVKYPGGATGSHTYA